MLFHFNSGSGLVSTAVRAAAWSQPLVYHESDLLQFKQMLGVGCGYHTAMIVQAHGTCSGRYLTDGLPRDLAIRLCPLSLV